MSLLDQHCRYQAEVVEPYDCTLNMTDIKTNKNKFYIMQVIKTSSGHQLYVRYGRVGEVGKISYMPGDVNFCTSKFESQFKSKTKNNWSSRDKFQHFKDKYYLCQKQKIADQDTEEAKKKAKTKIPDCTLDQRVQSFLSLISDVNMLKTTMKQLNVDEAKMPLGAISPDQLDAADQILSDIIDLIIEKPQPAPTQSAPTQSAPTQPADAGRVKLTLKKKSLSFKPAQAASPQAKPAPTPSPAPATQSKSLVVGKPKVLTPMEYERLIDLTNKYYTLVPFPVSRSNKPPIIDSQQRIDEYREALEDLKNLKIAYTMIENQSPQSGLSIHPLDHVYQEAGTTIQPLDRSTRTWEMIRKYVFQTQGATHYCNVELVDIYEISRHPENDWKAPARAAHNRTLLWHGTRLGNYLSIMKQGLLLDPSKTGAFITGKLYGFGIYAANSFSKSYNYTGCYQRGEEACLFLAEVALGNTKVETQPNYYITEQTLANTNHHSTWGRGMNTPDSHEVLDDGTIVPNGKLVSSNFPGAYLIYDEFVVYNIDQIKLRYIVRVKNLG